MEEEIRPLPKFDYFSPHSLHDLSTLLKQLKGGISFLAGGTDLLVNMKKRITIPKVIIDINRIQELSFIEKRSNNIHVGSVTRLNNLIESSIVQENVPLLTEAIRFLASHPIRNRATIGGNLCTASPAADAAPPLLALNASVKLKSPDDEKIVPLSEFFVGPRQTVRKHNEVLTEIIIPCEKGSNAFMKLGRRRGFSLSVVSVAAFGIIKGDKFEDIRIALGGVAPTPIRAYKIEEMLKGVEVSDRSIEKAAEIAKSISKPSKRAKRASVEYREAMARVLTKRVLMKIAFEERG